MAIRNPRFEQDVRAVFAQAAFVSDLGIRLDGVGEGWCESVLEPTARHSQQDGYVHAGVLATLADHTAGGAAATLIAPGQGVLSVEFKLNLLRPALGSRLRCRASVLKAGRTLSFVESEVWVQGPDGELLVAKASVTIAIVAR